MLRRLILALSLACALAAQAGERIALVIGNSDYKNSPLVNPRNDARDNPLSFRASNSPPTAHPPHSWR